MSLDKIKFKNYEDFWWIPNLICKCIGYNGLGVPLTRLHYIFNQVLFVVMWVIHFYCKYYMFRELFLVLKSGDLKNTISTASYVAYSIDSNIKFLTIIINLQKVKNINNSLRNIYPQTQFERQLFNVNKHYWSKRVLAVILVYYIATLFIVFTPLLQSIFYYAWDTWWLKKIEVQFHYLKPMPMEYGFDYRSTWKYVGTYVLELMYIFFTTLTNAGTDIWLVAFLIQICMHFDYIKNALMNYEPTLLNYNKDCIFLSKLIRRHQLMYHLMDELNSVIDISVAFTLFSTTALFCVMAVQLSLEGLSMFFFVLFIYITISLLQFALVCKYGEYLINVSGNLAQAAYEHSWYNCDNRYKKMILIFMLRAQRSAQVKATALDPISLNSLKMVLIMTYRVYTVVRAMMD